MVSLGLFLSFQLVKHLNVGETKAAELAGLMIGRSNRTIKGQIPECKQGQYQHSGVVWKNEELNKKATIYVWNNNIVKERANLTISSFCGWINDELLPNETLEPRTLSVETTQKWLALRL